MKELSKLEDNILHLKTSSKEVPMPNRFLFERILNIQYAIDDKTIQNRTTSLHESMNMVINYF